MEPVQALFPVRGQVRGRRVTAVHLRTGRGGEADLAAMRAGRSGGSRCSGLTRARSPPLHLSLAAHQCYYALIRYRWWDSLPDQEATTNGIIERTEIREASR